MSSRMGKMLSVQLFGESHGSAVGVTLDGVPAGFSVDEEAMEHFLRRRKADGGDITTKRQEKDLPKIISGIYRGMTTGQPVTAIFENENSRCADYDFLPDVPRPGHADYPALVKSGGFDDLRGGGHYSGRLTLPYTFAGGVIKQILEAEGIRIMAHVLSIGDVKGRRIDPLKPEIEALAEAWKNDVPALDKIAAKAMKSAILMAKSQGDSLGGRIECVAIGVPAGLGAPFFEGVEATAAAQFFSIPAVKGVEFGEGFAAAELRGSEYNDPYIIEEDRVTASQNAAGGLLGGMANGMPILARVAFRPTASIGIPQKSVSLSEKKDRTLQISGRHDPCVVIRAVPVVEAAMALALGGLWLERRGNAPFKEAMDDR